MLQTGRRAKRHQTSTDSPRPIPERASRASAQRWSIYGLAAALIASDVLRQLRMLSQSARDRQRYDRLQTTRYRTAPRRPQPTATGTSVPHRPTRRRAVKNSSERCDVRACARSPSPLRRLKVAREGSTDPSSSSRSPMHIPSLFGPAVGALECGVLLIKLVAREQRRRSVLRVGGWCA